MEGHGGGRVRVLPVRARPPASCTLLSDGWEALTSLLGRVSLITFQCQAGSVTLMGSEQDKTGPACGGEGPMRGTPCLFQTGGLSPHFPLLVGGAGEAWELRGGMIKGTETWRAGVGTCIG
jgi:hypothetical protein